MRLRECLGLCVATVAGVSAQATSALGEVPGRTDSQQGSAQAARTDVEIQTYGGIAFSSASASNPYLMAGLRPALGYGYLQTAASLEMGIASPSISYKQAGVEIGPRYRGEDYVFGITGQFAWRWYNWGAHQGARDEYVPVDFSTPALGGRAYASMLMGHFEAGAWLMLQTDLRREQAPATDSGGHALDPTQMGQTSFGGGLHLGAIF